jgi:hypothetical protein
MRRRICSLLLLIITCGVSLFAQDLVSRNSILENSALREPGEQNNYNLSQFGNETWNFIKQPAGWDGSDWLKVGLTGAGTFLILEEADQPIREAVLRDHRYELSVPIESGRVWGEVYTPAIIFSGFAIHSWVTGDIRTRKIAFEFAQALLYGGGLNLLIKTVVGRPRPYTNEGPRSFHPFGGFSFLQGNQSFPGGHCVCAFAMSTVLSRNVRPLWLKGLVYLPSALTFVARVYQDKHWTSDDFIGAAIGYFSATWVVDQHEQGESRVHISSIFPLTVSVALD